MQNKIATIPGVTWKEIQGQPQLWRNLAELFPRWEQALHTFFDALPEHCEAILTGAGSSAFVGEAVSALFERKTGIRSRAVATTDLVTHPELHLPRTLPILLISYARSGNSPESVAAVELAEQVHGDVYHLVITCNAEGALARRPASPRTCLLLLPPEANDQGLAMIGSVTGMILATLLVADRHSPQRAARDLLAASTAGERLLQDAATFALCERLAQLPFERLVCLGSGPLLGVAREAHLKVQELSDGRVIAKFDSFLGFRHGLKAVVDERTLLLYLESREGYVRRYEDDLTRSIETELRPLATVTLAARSPSPHARHSILLDPHATVLDDAYLLPLYLLPAQILAVLKSRQLGLNPDSPSARGAIHRVVQGVTIHPYGDRA